jgi:hypothetical protein
LFNFDTAKCPNTNFDPGARLPRQAIFIHDAILRDERMAREEKRMPDHQTLLLDLGTSATGPQGLSKRCAGTSRGKSPVSWAASERRNGARQCAVRLDA